MGTFDRTGLATGSEGNGVRCSPLSATRDGHAGLTAFDRTLTGCDRYREAGVEVIDMATDVAVPQSHAGLTGV